MLEFEQYKHFVSTIPTILPTNPHFWLHYININDAQLHLTTNMCFMWGLG
jgi:hypothetical protein